MASHWEEHILRMRCRAKKMLTMRWILHAASLAFLIKAPARERGTCDEAADEAADEAVDEAADEAVDSTEESEEYLSSSSFSESEEEEEEETSDEEDILIEPNGRSQHELGSMSV